MHFSGFIAPSVCVQSCTDKTYWRWTTFKHLFTTPWSIQLGGAKVVQLDMFPHLPIYLANYISKYKYICTCEPRNNGWSTEAMAIGFQILIPVKSANFSFAYHFGSFIWRALHKLCSTKSNIKKMPSQIFSWPNITSWPDWKRSSGWV